MPLLHYKCPNCNRPSAFDPDGSCLNILKSGETCGWQMPITFESGNSTFRKKMTKHTTAPESGVKGTYSWVAGSGTYELYQEEATLSGSVLLDPEMAYLFLWLKPSGEQPIASLLHADALSVESASGIVMPLNSRIKNLHHHYSNHEARFVTIADGPGLTIESPDLSGSNEYRVVREDKLVYAYDPVTRTGRTAEDVGR